MSQYPRHNATSNTLDSVLTSHSKGAAYSSLPRSQGNIKDVHTPNTNQSATTRTNPHSSRLNSGGPPQFRSFLYAVEIPFRKKPFQRSQSSSQNHSSIAVQPAPTIPKTMSNLNEARPHPNANSSLVTRGLTEADRSIVADRSAARSSGAREKKRNEKYFSDDARAKLLTAFTKNNYPDNDVKDQLATELDLTPIQVSRWFNNYRNAVRHGKGVYSGLNLVHGTSDNASEIKQDVDMKSESRDPKISVKNEHRQESSRDCPMRMEGVLGSATVQIPSDPPPRTQSRPIDRDLTNKAPKQTRPTDVVQRMMYLLQGGSIVKPENVRTFVELMEEVEDDLETMRTMLIALQASKSPLVQKTFVDSSGFLVLQKWMKLARKDPTNPPCLQVLEKAILVLHELPLTLKHLQGSSVGVTVSKLAADTNATLKVRIRATQLKEHWMQMVDNNTNKIPRSETEDTHHEHPRKKTRMDGVQTQLSEEQTLPKFMKHKPSAIQLPPFMASSNPLPPPATTTTTTKPKPKAQENANFFKELASGALPHAPPQPPSSNSRALMSPRSPVVERLSSLSEEAHHNQKNPRFPVLERFPSSAAQAHQNQTPRSPVLERFSSSTTVEVPQQNQQSPPPPVLERLSSSAIDAQQKIQQNPQSPDVERFSSSSTTDAHQQAQPNHLQNDYSKNQSSGSEGYQDSYMDVDSNQQFEAAKVHLQKAILKRKDQGQTTKKSVNFKVGKDLVAVRYFESEPPYHEHEYEDEDRRHQEEGDERERRARDELYDDRHGSGHHDQLNADFERWSLRQYNPNKSEFTMSYSVTRGLVDGDYWRSPMVLTILPTTVKCAVRSSEIAAQAYREATVPPVQYHSLDHIPLSPAEPDPETIPPGPPTRNIALWNSHATNAGILLGSLQAISGFLSRSQLGHEPVGRFMSPMPMPMSMHPSQH